MATRQTTRQQSGAAADCDESHQHDLAIQWVSVSARLLVAVSELRMCFVCLQAF